MSDIIDTLRQAVAAQTTQNNVTSGLNNRSALPGTLPLGQATPPNIGDTQARDTVNLSRNSQQLALRQQQRQLQRPELNQAQQTDAINANAVLSQVESTIRAALSPDLARQLDGLLNRLGQLEGLNASGGADRQQRIETLLTRVDDIFEQGFNALGADQQDAALSALDRLEALDAGASNPDATLNALIDASVVSIDDILTGALSQTELDQLDGFVETLDRLEGAGQIAAAERQVDQLLDVAQSRLNTAQQTDLQNRLIQLDNFVNGNVLSSPQQQQLNVVSAQLNNLLNPQIPTQGAATSLQNNVGTTQAQVGTSGRTDIFV